MHTVPELSSWPRTLACCRTVLWYLWYVWYTARRRLSDELRRHRLEGLVILRVNSPPERSADRRLLHRQTDQTRSSPAAKTYDKSVPVDGDEVETWPFDPSPIRGWAPEMWGNWALRLGVDWVDLAWAEEHGIERRESLHCSEIWCLSSSRWASDTTCNDGDTKTARLRRAPWLWYGHGIEDLDCVTITGFGQKKKPTRHTISLFVFDTMIHALYPCVLVTGPAYVFLALTTKKSSAKMTVPPNL